MDINLFGNRTFVDKIKLRWGCTKIAYALNPVVGVLLRKRKGTEKDTETDRRPCDGGDRDWNDASISQG